MELAPALVDDYVDRALREDLGGEGDLTSSLVFTGPRHGAAEIVAREACVLAGLPIAERVFRTRDSEVIVECPSGGDGVRVADGAVVMTLRGDAAALLAAERTALNFLQRLSGIATVTRAFVDAVHGTGSRILDTRKTTPTLRVLEKYAVRMGGGENHRVGLHDQVLLKDNHFDWAGIPYEAVVSRVVESGRAGPAPVVAEARDLDEARAAVRGGAGIVMLDNFSIPDGLRKGIRAVRDQAASCGRTALVEASGGITLSTVRAVAECGVDRISVGALTHSARSIDLSMLVHAEAE